MHEYVRPPLDLGTYLDERGDPIPYGHRWHHLDEGGPDDTYSVCRHPQRFAPLLDVARALLEHLVDSYDVALEVHGDTHRLTPADTAAAPLEITFTAMPGVTCRAGIMSDLAFYCGCDHCDEDVLDLATQLEDEVFAVVTGRFREYVETDGDTIWASSELCRPDGSPWMRNGGAVEHDPVVQDALRRRLSAAPAWWAAWPSRPAGVTR